MGRAIITEALGDGLYTVSLDYGAEEKASRLASAEANLANMESQTGAAQSAVNAARNTRFVARADLNNAIDAWAIAPENDKAARKAAVDKAAEAAVRAQLAFERAEAKKRDLDTAIAAETAEIAELSAIEVTETREAWCADFTDDASGPVATLEVNGEGEGIIIAPGAPEPTGANGELVARPIQTGAQVFLNAALLPGWQIHEPTYRIGAITALDGNICTVALDAAKSSAQDLPVNKLGTLYNVPIEYMTCNGSDFELGDRVVVDLSGGWDAPKVVGFESNPRNCFEWMLDVVEGSATFYLIPRSLSVWQNWYGSGLSVWYRVDRGPWVNIAYNGYQETADGQPEGTVYYNPSKLHLYLNTPSLNTLVRLWEPRAIGGGATPATIVYDRVMELTKFANSTEPYAFGQTVEWYIKPGVGRALRFAHKNALFKGAVSSGGNPGTLEYEWSAPPV